MKQQSQSQPGEKSLKKLLCHSPGEERTRSTLATQQKKQACGAPSVALRVMEPAHQTAAMALSDDALLFAEFDIDGNAALDFDEVRACAIMLLVGSHTRMRPSGQQVLVLP